MWLRSEYSTCLNFIVAYLEYNLIQVKSENAVCMAVSYSVHVNLVSVNVSDALVPFNAKGMVKKNHTSKRNN